MELQFNFKNKSVAEFLITELKYILKPFFLALFFIYISKNQVSFINFCNN